MQIICSKTGSDGNFSMIYDGAHYLAIDCGVPYKKANQLCGYKLIKACGLLITHKHSDHLGCVRQYIPSVLNIFVGKDAFYDSDYMFMSETEEIAYGDKIHLIDGSQFRVGSYIIKPFNVPHTDSDGGDCENFGFLIYSLNTKEKLLWITDCAYIQPKFPACDYICVECNYIDVDDYSEEIKYVDAPVENRRVRSHLSLSRCVDFISKQDLSKIKFVKLLHLTKNQGIIEDAIKKRFAEEFPNLEVII